MSANRKFGVILILIGVGAFLISLGFVDGYNPKAGLLWSLGKMELVLSEGKLVSPGLDIVDPFSPSSAYYEGQISLSYKYFLFFDVVLIFLGIGIFALSQRKV